MIGHYIASYIIISTVHILAMCPYIYHTHKRDINLQFSYPRSVVQLTLLKTGAANVEPVLNNYICTEVRTYVATYTYIPQSDKI